MSVYVFTVCIVLGVIALTICIGTGAYFTYKYINRNKENVSNMIMSIMQKIVKHIKWEK